MNGGARSASPFRTPGTRGTHNPDKDNYLRPLERLRHVMILLKLGYGSREMAMLRVNSSRRYPEAYEALEGELEGL